MVFSSSLIVLRSLAVVDYLPFWGTVNSLKKNAINNTQLESLTFAQVNRVQAFD
jgi:hypothetical protein